MKPNKRPTLRGDGPLKDKRIKEAGDRLMEAIQGALDMPRDAARRTSEGVTLAYLVRMTELVTERARDVVAHYYDRLCFFPEEAAKKRARAMREADAARRRVSKYSPEKRKQLEAQARKNIKG